MRRSIIAAALLLACGWGTSVASADYILRVDFGATGQTVGAGWEPFNLSAVTTVLEASNTFSGITIALDGRLEGDTVGYLTARNRDAVTFDTGLDAVLSDTAFYKKDGTLTISGLAANTGYDLTTYHHDSRTVQQSSFDILLTTGGSSTTMATGLLASTGTTPTTITSANFLATSDANGTIEITFDKMENPPEPGTDWTTLSGLDIATAPVPEPSTLVLAVVGLLGLAWCGWRRKR